MTRALHFGAGIVATLTIGTLITSSAVVELFGSHEAVRTVKHLIVWPGLIVLVSAIALTAATGFARSRSRDDVRIGAKKKRMPFIGANGLVILIPCAIMLDHWAAAGRFDGTFYAVQVVELLAGAANFVLMSLNIRDGLSLSGAPRRAA